MTLAATGPDRPHGRSHPPTGVLRPRLSRRSIKGGRKVCATVAMAILLASGAGQARTLQERLQTACADDVRRLCPDKAAGSDDLKACLLVNRPRVSAPCMTLVDASE